MELCCTIVHSAMGRQLHGWSQRKATFKPARAAVVQANSGSAQPDSQRIKFQHVRRCGLLGSLRHGLDCSLRLSQSVNQLAWLNPTPTHGCGVDHWAFSSISR